MKQLLLFFTFIGYSLVCRGQQDTIKEAELIFEKPNSKWFLKEIRDTNNWKIYWYKREEIIDSEGHYIIPNIAFMVESIPDTVNIDVTMYSISRRGMFPAKTIGMFGGDTGSEYPKYKSGMSLPKMNYKNAMGFKGLYTDMAGEHTVYLVFLLHNRKGVIVIMDMTSELFKKYGKEFADGLSSIREL